MRLQKVWFFSLFVALRCFVGVVQPDTVAAENPDLFPAEWIIKETIVLEQRGDEADVYFPEPPADLRPSFEDAFPVVAMLQGAGVDKSFYSQFSTELACFGFVVVVPNHFQTPPFPPGMPPSLLPDQFVVLDVLAQMELEDTEPASPLFGIVDTASLGLTGHSFGGVTGLFVIDGRCDGPPFCDAATFGPFEQPAALQAGAFYGTNTCSSSGTLSDSRCIDVHATPPNPFGMLIDVETSGFPVTLVQGSLDSIAPPSQAAATFDILDGPRELATIEGANHYGITDVNNPPGAIPDQPGVAIDPRPQDVAQAIGQLLSANLKGTRVTLCHKGKKTKTLPLPAVSAHLNHGDTLGACS